MARIPVEIMTVGNRSELPSAQFQVDNASAASFGGQEASALAGVGEAVGGLAAKITANQKRVAEFGYEEQFIKLQEADNTDYEARQRQNLAGSGEGWWQGARITTKTRFDEWLGQLPEQARAEYQVKAARFVAARTNSAFQDQYKQQDTNTKQVLTEEQRKAGLQVQNNPLTYEQFAQQQTDLIDKSTLPPAEKERLKAEAKNSLAYVAESSRAQKDPAGVIAGQVGGGFREALRSKESGGNDAAQNSTSSARGRYQFLAGTWNAFAGKAGAPPVTPENSGTASDPRNRPDLQEKVLDHYIAASTAKLTSEKLPVTDANLYVLHFMGQDGGAKFIRALQTDASASAATLFPKEAADNRSIFFARNEARSVSEVYASLTRGFNGSGTTAAPSAAAGNLTPQQNAAVTETAQRSLVQQTALAEQAAQSALEAKRNALYIDLKEGTAPQAAYQDARRTGLLSDYDQISKAENIIKARFKDEEDFGVGLGLMQSGRAVSNPYDKTHRDGVTAYYERGIKAGGDPAVLAAQVFDKTGIVPQQFATAIRGALISEDKARVSAGLSVTANMLRQNPNALAGVEGGSDLENSAIEYRRLTEGLGMSTEQAAERIVRDARDPEKLSPVKQEQLQQFRKQSLSQEKIDERLQSSLSSWNPFSDAPFSAQLPTGQQRTALSGFYKAFAEEGFERHRDPDAALKYADAQFGKQFGTQNGTITRYPPAKTGLPKISGSGSDGYRWINEQAAQTVKDQMGVVVDPDQIVLVPVERDGVSTRAGFDGKPMDVKRPDGGSYQSVPYQIIVQPKTPEQEAIVLLGAYFPDVDTYVGQKNKEIEKLNATPLTGYDQFGIPFAVAPAQRSLLETPTQQKRAAEAATAARLRAGQEQARRKNETEGMTFHELNAQMQAERNGP